MRFAVHLYCLKSELTGSFSARGIDIIGELTTGGIKTSKTGEYLRCTVIVRKRGSVAVETGGIFEKTAERTYHGSLREALPRR